MRPVHNSAIFVVTVSKLLCWSSSVFEDARWKNFEGRLYHFLVLHRYIQGIFFSLISRVSSRQQSSKWWRSRVTNSSTALPQLRLMANGKPFSIFLKYKTSFPFPYLFVIMGLLSLPTPEVSFLLERQEASKCNKQLAVFKWSTQH